METVCDLQRFEASHKFRSPPEPPVGLMWSQSKFINSQHLMVSIEPKSVTLVNLFLEFQWNPPYACFLAFWSNRFMSNADASTFYCYNCSLYFSTFCTFNPSTCNPYSHISTDLFKKSHNARNSQPYITSCHHITYFHYQFSYFQWNIVYLMVN